MRWPPGLTSLIVFVCGLYWALIPLFLPFRPDTEEDRGWPDSAPSLDTSDDPNPPPFRTWWAQAVETLKPPVPPHRRPPRSKLTLPVDQWYRPKLYPSLYLHNLPCVGVWDAPVLPRKPLPPNPRFVLLVDSWERQQTGTKTVENAATIADRFGLVLVTPHVRMSNIQGIPGWTQWMSTHALDGFSSARYLLPMEVYYDLDYTRGFLPLISFPEFLNLSNYTITTALMLDWEKNGCRGNKPEWFPSYAARVQATRFQCMPANFPAKDLTQAIVDRWFDPSAGTPIAEALGRPPPSVPSVAFLNWRKHSFGKHEWDDGLWVGKCRFRWNRRWNATAVAWAEEHLPDKYVAIKIRSGDFLRDFWLPKSRGEVQVCFDHMVAAAQYYLRALGLPLDAPVYLSTEWPNPPESRLHFNTVAILTAAFNSLYRALTLVTYHNKDYDIGIVTIISFNLLLNAAVVVAFEDTMVGLIRQYNPHVPLAVVGSQSERKCNNWNPPTHPRPKEFLYLVQAKSFPEKLRFSDNGETLCLTWEKPSPHCEFLPTSSWTAGRNRLWQAAAKLQKRYTYYIFLDDDVQVSAPEEFERLLLKWRPAVGVPGNAAHLPTPWGPPGNESESVWVTAYHAYYNAYHRDVFFHSLVLPYYDGLDGFSWWTSQLYAAYLARVFHPNETLVFQRVTATNWRTGKFPQEWDLNVMNRPFIEECIPNATFRAAHWGGFALQAGVVHTPAPPNRSHALHAATLREYLTLDTPYWRRIRSIRAAALGDPP